MSHEIPIAFVDQVTANILMLSQQKQSMLRQACRMEPVTGDHMFVERLGPKDAQPRGARHGETPISDASHTRRMLSMVDYVVPADLIDNPDKLKMLIDPQNVYIQNQVSSLNRQIDDVIIAAAMGSAWGGHTGTTEITFHSVGESRLIDADGTLNAAGEDFADVVETPLTIAKLMSIKQFFDDANVDEGRRRFLVANPYNINQFMNQAEVKSSDYNTVKALAQGHVGSYMGFEFIQSTRLPVDDTETGGTKCFAFAEGAIVLAIAEEPTVSIDKRPDLLNSTQIYSTLSIGATRVEGPAVVGICLETP